MTRLARLVPLLVILGACAPARRPPAETPVMPPDECALLPAAALETRARTGPPTPGREPLVIALTQPVVPGHAPEPSTDAERLVFRQLYETLVRVDCSGRVLPGLADAWERGPDGAWRFTLRSEARFWDGAPVTAADVVSGWSSRTRPAAATDDLMVGGVVRASASALSERVLVVSLETPEPAGGPVAFADPGFAVTKPSSATRWPIGTGRYWPVADGGAERTVITARPVSGAGGAIRFIDAAGDPRDALDRGVDLLVTDDRAVLGYGLTLPDYVAVALPWDRSYVLAGRLDADAIPEEVRASLARDAVRRDARGAEPPFWWRDRSTCGVSGRGGSTTGSMTRDARIVYPEADPTARELAARLVALAARPDDAWLLGAVLPGPLAAVGLEPEAFTEALTARGAAAYVVAVPRRPLASCAALDRLRTLLLWATLVPLVDTRRHALARRDLPPMVVEWDGTPMVTTSGSRRAP